MSEADINRAKAEAAAAKERLLNSAQALQARLKPASLASDAVLAQVRMLFPDWCDDEPVVGPDAFAAAGVDDSVRGYLNALMMDLALADPDQRDVALLRAGQVARSLGSLDALQLNLRRDAGLGKRDLERYKRQLTGEKDA